MRFDVLSLFPEYFDGPLDVSILKRARNRGIVDISLTNIRDFARDKRRTVDGKPYGGGPGMVMLPAPVVDSVRAVRTEASRTIYLSPQGTPLTACLCQQLAKESHLVLLCGHYEGIDERALRAVVDAEISIGDYVLTNGCLAALVLIDAISRFLPGVVGNHEGPLQDSFQDGVFDAPQFTGPREFEEMRVPEVLLSGHHAKIAQWRKECARAKTCKVRPDLLPLTYAREKKPPFGKEGEAYQHPQGGQQ